MGLIYGGDLLIGGTASADKLDVGSFASNACDNNIATSWITDTSGFPHFWKYDFGAGVTKIIRCIRLTSTTPSDPAQGVTTKNFTFQGSNNDSTWVTLYTGTALNNTNMQEFGFVNLTAYRYYKIIFSDAYYTGYTYAGLKEIELAEYAFNTAKEIIKTNLYPSTALKMYHQFEGNSTDTTTNDHDGTDTAITYGTDYGVFNQGALFNGTSAYITVNTSEDFDFGAGEFVMGGWCFLNEAIGTQRNILSYVAAANWTSTGIEWNVCITTEGKLNIAWNDGANSANGIGSPATINPSNVWKHWVITRKVNTIYIYIDGNYNASVGSLGTLYTSGGTKKLYIGSLITTTYPFKGSLDDMFLIKGTGLTAEQVYYLYNHRSVGVMK